MQVSYRQITTERVAYKNGSNRGVWDYSDELVAYRNGIIVSILEDSKLSVSSKERQMERYGSLFRRDVIIPNEIGELKTMINQSESLLKSPNISNENKSLLRSTINSMKDNIKDYENESKEITRKYGQ